MSFYVSRMFGAWGKFCTPKNIIIYKSAGIQCSVSIVVMAGSRKVIGDKCLDNLIY